MKIRITLSAICVVMLAACTGNIPADKTAIPKSVKPIPLQNNPGIAGNYVNADYALRSKGYDWVAVMVSQIGSNEIGVRVRSRADKKRPTCTLDAVAYQLKDGLYRATLKEGKILFAFSGNSLSITPETPKDEVAVYFYCSGGGSLKGRYEKTSGQIDTVKSGNR